MTRLKLLSATAILATAIASPVMAQQPALERATAHHYNRDNRDFSRGDLNRGYRDSGFWPADVAAGVVGTAVGAAGAIATAPFRGDTYGYYDGNPYAYNPGSYAYYNGAYNNGYRGGYGNFDSNYAVRNGFVCQPGTFFRAEDGRRHICQ